MVLTTMNFANLFVLVVCEKKFSSFHALDSIVVVMRYGPMMSISMELRESR